MAYNNKSPPFSSRYSSDYDRLSLSSQIDEGKAKLQEMEAELTRLGSRLELLSPLIKKLEETIENYESQVVRGQDVDQAVYNDAIDTHNMFVEEHNRLLGDYRIRYNIYEKELKRVNEMIDQYNRTRY